MGLYGSVNIIISRREAIEVRPGDVLIANINGNQTVNFLLYVMTGGGSDVLSVGALQGAVDGVRSLSLPFAGMCSM